MSKAIHRVCVLTIAITGALAGCAQYDEPDAQDPLPILGCYEASGAPSLSVGPKGVQIEGSSVKIPFRYEFRSSSAVLNAQIEATQLNGRFHLSPARNRYFYPISHTEEGPVITIAFAPDSTILNYYRRSVSACEF